MRFIVSCLCYNLVMRTGRRDRKRSFIFGMVAFVFVFVGVIVGVQFFTKSGIFHTPGIVYYDENIDDKLLTELNKIFTEDVVLDKDVYISSAKSNVYPELQDGEILYQIAVPVTNYYNARNDISEYTMGEYSYIPIEDLDHTQKLLTVDGKYYLDNFDSGAIFYTVRFDSEKYSEEIAPLVEPVLSKEFPNKSSVLSMVQTGVTALSRGMNEKLDAVGDATYFAENIKDYLSSFDITHTSNEASFSESATYDNICSDPRFINTLTAIGLDIVELTGNHNQDCGNDAAANTIDIYAENNIRTVGGGKTAEEAAAPLEIDEKNTKITMLAYNESTGGATYGDTPGANQYYEQNAEAEISAAKARGDIVIVDVQYYECSAYDSSAEDTTCDYADSAAGDQVGLFRYLAELGADIVVGTSAHQPQTFELYGDSEIYYGLGNLFFDQIWWPGTTRSLALEHYFYNGKLLQTRTSPTVYDSSMQTRLMDADTKEQYIDRLVEARP